MKGISLKLLMELLVSYSMRKDGSDSFVVGGVENISERSFPCVKLRFSLQAPNDVPRRNLGILDVEVRNYEKKLPQPAGCFLLSKEECQ
jgi:hypothetical protein